jgi:hypothetical protein
MTAGHELAPNIFIPFKGTVIKTNGASFFHRYSVGIRPLIRTITGLVS